MSKSNPKRFWSFFRNKTKSKSLPSKIQNDSAGSTDPQGKACLFNDYFISVFEQVKEREEDQLPDIPIICEDHLSRVLMISTSLKFHLNSMLIKRVGLIMSPHMY